ncbi:hypothetical protein V6N12_072005 [Hibiscus sabdariffa]|uniref:Uncharacterized protein n=1 Tax=Hibiscus sabdariffa TaxID=183260 RepID=A0ABR2FLX8_9ROSI
MIPLHVVKKPVERGSGHLNQLVGTSELIAARMPIIDRITENGPNTCMGAGKRSSNYQGMEFRNSYSGNERPKQHWEMEFKDATAAA